jgi:hypothetical protein
VLEAGSLIDVANTDDIVRSTETDASGNVKVLFPLPGTCVVRATPMASTLYLPALLTGGLTITSGVDASGKLIVVTK